MLSSISLPAGWDAQLADEISQPYFAQLADFVRTEREQHEVFPPEAEVFSALRLTPFENVRVLLLGQDPYHDVGQAHGLCFSVKPGVKTPPSLVNVFKELRSDLGCTIPNHGHLTAWAEQGVLLLNAVLTVRAHAANSHKGRGWERFTDAIIRRVNERPHVVFLLWGAYAQKKAELIDESKHTVIKCAHPSPLSVRKFFGSKPFSKTNAALLAHDQTQIEWQLPNV